MMPTLCSQCVRWQPGWTCTAFPNGIPSMIIRGYFDHQLPHPDDQGLQYLGVDSPDLDPDFMPHPSHPFFRGFDPVDLDPPDPDRNAEVLDAYAKDPDNLPWPPT